MPGVELALQRWHKVEAGKATKFSAKVSFSPSSFNSSTAERNFQVHLYSSQHWKGKVKHATKINQRVPFTLEPCSMHSTHQAEDSHAYLGE